MLEKFKFCLFFHGLMISKQKISTKLIKNDLLGVVFKYVVVHFLQKKLAFWPKFALLGFIFPNLVWYR